MSPESAPFYGAHRRADNLRAKRIRLIRLLGRLNLIANPCRLAVPPRSELKRSVDHSRNDLGVFLRLGGVKQLIGSREHNFG
jgi:hypothetical protein